MGIFFSCSLFKKLANEMPAISSSIESQELDLVEKCHGQIEKVRIRRKSEKVTAASIFLKIFGPAGGSRTLPGAFAFRTVNSE